MTLIRFVSGNAPLYIVAFSVFIFVILFFASLGGAFHAYLKAMIGDRDALDAGFGSLNPFMHMDMLLVGLFLLTKVLIKKYQPFSWRWDYGVKGSMQRFLYVFATPMLHLFIASIILFFSVKYFGFKFFEFAISTPLSPSIELIKSVKLLVGMSSYKIIMMLFSLYSIVTNMFLAIIDLFIHFSEYVLYTYIFPHESNPWAIFLCYIALIFIFALCINFITLLCWRMISFPLSFI
jgi:hypothetical protein